MKTDERDIGGGNAGDEPPENVVRLPREWLGPLEDLVPMGSRARARAGEEADDGAVGDGAEALPPAADDFWGEGTAALHLPIQGPASPEAAFDGHEPGPRQPAVAGARTARLPRMTSVSVPSLRLPRRLWAAGAIAAVVVAVVVVAIIGTSEGSNGTPPRAAARTANASAPGAHTNARTTGTSAITAARVFSARPSTARSKRPGTVRSKRTSKARPTAHRHRARSTPHRAHRVRHVPIRRHLEHAATPVEHSSAGTAEPATGEQTTPTASSPPPSSATVVHASEPAAPVATSASDGTGSSGGTSASTGGGSAGSSGGGGSSGPAGPTGIGSANGCNPQCK